MDIGINEELASLFARALEVAEADKTAAQQYLSGIVLHIMGAVLAISQNKRYEVDNAAQKIESAKIIMHENVYKDIDPEELALKLGISYSWFRKVFKEYTGYAPAKYFQELKLRKAKQLLIESSMSVKEICYELNYTSTEHFFSVFKNVPTSPLPNIVTSDGEEKKKRMKTNKGKMRKITINLAAVAAFCIVVASPALVSSSCATPQTEQEDTTIIREDLGITALKYSSPEVPSSIEFCGKVIDLSRFDRHERMDRELLAFTYMHSTSLQMLKKPTVISPL